jgi:hypothetical protein
VNEIAHCIYVNGDIMTCIYDVTTNLMIGIVVGQEGIYVHVLGFLDLSL